MAKIVLVEDDPQEGLDLSDALMRKGHDVHWFRDARSAHDYLSEEPADVLLVDVFIRRAGVIAAEGGIWLIGQIRFGGQGSEPQRLRDMVVIAISGAFGTAAGRNCVATSAQTAGADLSLPKPVEVEKLDALIAERRVLRGAQHQDQMGAGS